MQLNGCNIIYSESFDSLGSIFFIHLLDKFILTEEETDVPYKECRMILQRSIRAVM